VPSQHAPPPKRAGKASILMASLLGITAALGIWASPCLGQSLQQNATQDETESPLQVLTLNEAVSEAQLNNRQVKISQQSVLYSNEQILATRTQRYLHFNVQLNGSYLLTPITIHVPEGVFGTVNGTPIPVSNSVITTNPEPSGMSIESR